MVQKGGAHELQFGRIFDPASRMHVSSVQLRLLPVSALAPQQAAAGL